MVLLHVDETHVRAYQTLLTTWAEVGNQKQVPSYGNHAHVSIFGAVDVQQGDVVFHRACIGQCVYSSCQDGASVP
ncbi:transposase [Neobacillus thermocopriae]|nr:transposase [Neobacillus thermocopriae]